MAEQTTPVAVVADTAATTGTQTVDAVAATGSPPNPKPVVDATGQTADPNSAAYWKAQADAAAAKVAAAEAEAKKAFQARDKAKQSFLDSPEGKSLMAEAAKAKQLEASIAAAKKKAEEDGAIARGEFEKLAVQRAVERDAALAKASEYEKQALDANKAAEARLAAYEENQRKASLRTTLDAAYKAAGGLDPEVFTLISQRFLDDGTVKVAEDGSIAGIAEAVKKIAEAKPFLFRGSSQEVLRRVAAQIPGGVQGAATGFAVRDEKQQQRTNNGQPWASLAESHLQGAVPPGRR